VLIEQMARESPSWGYKRTQDKLLSLGYWVGASTVRRAEAAANPARAAM